MKLFVSNLVTWTLFQYFIVGAFSEIIQLPRFVGPIENVTTPIGREATLACRVENLGSYKVAWVEVKTQTILSIHTLVITKNSRVHLSHTDSWTWNLHIRSVLEKHRGYYMCQINTDPMMSQLGYLQVVVPPDILDYPTSTDMVVSEGRNLTLMCAATGFPKPTVMWQREDKQKIPYGDQLVDTVEGSVFNITKANRLHMGAYLCIAANNVPPKVSRRILIIVHFPPMIYVGHQLVGAQEGEDIVLECQSEAFPKSINYWVKHNGDIIVSPVDGSPIDNYNGEKYEPVLIDNAYKVTMRLTIRSVQESDYGVYACLSKNSLGETDGQIKVYAMASSTVAAKTTTLPSSSSATNPNKETGKRAGNSHGDRTKSTQKATKANNGKSNSDNSLRPHLQSTTAVQMRNPEDASDLSSRNQLAIIIVLISSVLCLLYKNWVFN